MQTLEVGETTTLQVRFLNTAGTPTDPTTVTLTHTDPSGNVTTVLQAALTNSAVGVWSYVLTVDEAGIWGYRFEGTGAVVAGETSYLLVLAEGASPGGGPCNDWIDADDVFDCSPCADVAAASRDWGLAASVATAASRTLYLLSDRKYPGYCVSTVRPCRRGNWPVPSWLAGWGSCNCGAGDPIACSCGAGVDQVLLGSEPVVQISSVYVDGSLVAASAYEIHDYRWLVRIDGDGWPGSQDLSANPLTENNTFQVTFIHGRPVPEDGVRAAKLLACEMYQACASADSCVLPANIQSLVRQGIEIGFEAPDTLFVEGRTGIREVDRFLATERYADEHLPTAIVSPDFGATVRIVTG